MRAKLKCSILEWHNGSAERVALPPVDPYSVHPAYEAPEQARGHRDWIGTHSDVYAMGAVLYELVTGYQPFRAENSVAVLRAIIEEPLNPPSTLIEGLPSDLKKIILRAMAKDVRDRYQSAERMAADLRRFLRGEKP